MRPDGTPAHIREDSEAIVRGELARLANPPLFVKESVQYTPSPDAQQQARFEAYLIRRGQIPWFVTIPVFAREFTGGQHEPRVRGLVRRFETVPWIPTDDELAAVTEGAELLRALVDKLKDVPTPGGPTPRQLTG